MAEQRFLASHPHHHTTGGKDNSKDAGMREHHVYHEEPDGRSITSADTGVSGASSMISKHRMPRMPENATTTPPPGGPACAAGPTRDGGHRMVGSMPIMDEKESYHHPDAPQQEGGYPPAYPRGGRGPSPPPPPHHDGGYYEQRGGGGGPPLPGPGPRHNAYDPSHPQDPYKDSRSPHPQDPYHSKAQDPYHHSKPAYGIPEDSGGMGPGGGGGPREDYGRYPGEPPMPHQQQYPVVEEEDHDDDDGSSAYDRDRAETEAVERTPHLFQGRPPPAHIRSEMLGEGDDSTVSTSGFRSFYSDAYTIRDHNSVATSYVHDYDAPPLDDNYSVGLRSQYSLRSRESWGGASLDSRGSYIRDGRRAGGGGGGGGYGPGYGGPPPPPQPHHPDSYGRGPGGPDDGYGGDPYGRGPPPPGGPNPHYHHPQHHPHGPPPPQHYPSHDAPNPYYREQPYSPHLRPPPQSYPPPPPPPPPPRQQPPNRPLLEVAPGLLMHLMGTDETMKAIQAGHITVTSCVVCGMDVHCHSDSEYVLCPDCRVVSPVNQLDNANMAPQQGGLVGLGIKTEMLLTMMEAAGVRQY